MSTVAENLNAVADMIKERGMFCKEAWSRIVEGQRKGCAEGLLAEQLGLYNGMTHQLAQVQDDIGHYQLLNLGEVLNFTSDSSEEDDDYLIRLRRTEEWRILAQTIKESDPEKYKRLFGRVVIGWNDDEATTEHDVEMMFRKAAIAAEEQVS